MSSDENEDFCDYQIVEFITRERPSVRKIDLVPTKWIHYDIKKGRLMTKFMPPPYEEEDFKLIIELAKNLADAPNDWVTYGIKVRARAKTYTDGCAKLKSLEDQLYAFTDSGADPEKVAANIKQSLKTQTLKQVENLKVSLSAVTPIPEKSKRDTSRPRKKKKPVSDQSARKVIKATTSSKQQVSQKDERLICSTRRILSCDEDSISDEAENHTSSILKQTEKDIGLQLQLQLPNVPNMPNVCDNHDLKIDEFNNNNTSEVIPKIKNSTMVIQKFVGTVKEDATKHSKSLNKNQFQLIMNCFQEISVTVNEVLKNQREMKDLLEASGVIKDGIGAHDELFTDKYNICFPMRTKDDLNALQEMLRTNDICRRDFKASLYFLIDPQLNINKSVTNIIKKLMTRELALICIAQKKIDGKIALKENPISNCIIDVIVDINEKHGKCITQKEIYSATSITLTNAKDWDGHRSRRSKKKKNGDQINP